MRNFEERKAEVFRRSKKRIKKRNRILALCIPLCLTVCFATILPSMLPVGRNDAKNKHIDNISEEMVDAQSNSGLAHSFVLVDVKGAQSQYHCTISDAPGVNDVFEQIYTILRPYASYKEILGDFGTVDIPDGEIKDPVTKASSYIITMTTANGVNRTFTLTDNKLYDGELHLEIELTDEQIRDLKSALGLGKG